MAERKRAPRPGEGRPAKYKSKYCDAMVQYFRTCEDFPTFEGFADTIEVDGSTIVNWSKTIDEFFAAYTRAKSIQTSRLVTGAMGNRYNSQFAQFFAKNCLGYKDKVEQEISGGIRIELGDMDEAAD